MKLEALIFDFGWTLFYFKDVSVDKYFDCYRRGLRKVAEFLETLGVLPDSDSITRFKRLFSNERAKLFKESIRTRDEHPTHSIFKTIVEEMELKLSSDVKYQNLADKYHSCEEDEWIPFEQTRSTLELLKQKYNLKLGVLSNHPNHNTIINLLNKHDLTQFFDTIVTSGKFGKRKPDSSIFLHTLNELGLKNSETSMMCGDEYADIHGGHKAGLKTILCRRMIEFPFEKEIDVSNCITINNISEIVKYLE